jgi:hypothetical protein
MVAIAFGFSAVAVGLPVGVGFFLLLRGVFGFNLQSVSLHLEDYLLLLHAVAAALTVLVAFAIVALAQRWLDRRGSLAEVGWVRPGESARLLASAAAVSGLLAGLVVAAEFASGRLVAQPAHWLSESWADIFWDLLGYAVILACTAVGEELIFRGYVRWTLTARFPPSAALVLSAVLFAIFRAFAPFASLPGVAGALLAGLILGGLAQLSGSLWVPISVHLAWVLVEGLVFSLPVAGTPVEGLIDLRVIGGLVSGGNFGPEAGLVGLAAMLAAAVLVWTAARRRATPQP